MTVAHITRKLDVKQQQKIHDNKWVVAVLRAPRHIERLYFIIPAM